MNENNMLAVRQYKSGGPLVTETAEIPVPGKGEVLIKMAAAPVNPSDLSFISGHYGSPLKFPVTPGFEGSGTVVAHGGGMIAKLRMGKRVACTSIPAGDGTWAEYMVTSATRCVTLSDRISFEQGSMMLINPMTAMALIDNARRENHRAIVNNAAASALGKMLLYLCGKAGIPLICVVRNEKQEEILKGLGGQYILNSSKPGFSEDLSQLAEKLSATFLLDAIGGKAGSAILEAAPRNSKIVVYAKLSGEKIEVDPRNLLRKHQSIEGFQLGNYLENKSLLYKLGLARRVRIFMEEQTGIIVQKQFSIHDIENAIDTYKGAMGAGKVLLKY